ncbi:hypothetical protein JAAARDRAFT_603355 [Jaapia argillacea MUCL 33604]|uniref:Uncharacterized protein n=1 Tax=Jaapia argillacea MUCL 33604 TaxID=933084 RepID=A0A067PZU4_9AGAM|nr:hypothetical protein JAAARDRAFT_603355 [Jaapia argillacea MUCL 33604]
MTKAPYSISKLSQNHSARAQCFLYDTPSNRTFSLVPRYLSRSMTSQTLASDASMPTSHPVSGPFAALRNHPLIHDSPTLPPIMSRSPPEFPLRAELDTEPLENLEISIALAHFRGGIFRPPPRTTASTFLGQNPLISWHAGPRRYRYSDNHLARL